MRALWVDAGTGPNWTKCQHHRMTALFFPVTDTLASLKQRMADSRARGYAVGVYMAWNWPEFDGRDGATMAELMHGLCTPLVPPFKVQFDIEEHDPELVLDCLRRWRALNPKVDTSWTMEPMQGGWMGSTFVEGVIRQKVRVVPQAYTGPMVSVCTRAVCTNLEDAGFPSSIVSPFYDAKALPLYWDGFAFTQGRLP